MERWHRSLIKAELVFFGIEDVLLNFVKDFGAEPILEDGNIIGARRGETTISLEPGGQFELSGAPFPTVHDTWRELEGPL